MCLLSTLNKLIIIIIFEPICKARLENGNEKKKRFLKRLLSALKADCQAFWVAC